ncbi:MAG: hypothetical protein JW384_00317 [Nitrosomonadaceae bacterium]|nr:hypothetical protein [Nitrosomonadaceae bacterium]
MFPTLFTSVVRLPAPGVGVIWAYVTYVNGLRISPTVKSPIVPISRAEKNMSNCVCETRGGLLDMGIALLSVFQGLA